MFTATFTHSDGTTSIITADQEEPGKEAVATARFVEAMKTLYGPPRSEVSDKARGEYRAAFR